MTETLAEPRVARLSEQEAVNFGPLAAYRKLVGGDAVPIFTGVQTCNPGYMTKPHWHPYVECLFVVEGVATVYMHGREAEALTLNVGDIVALPPNKPHVFGNAGTATLRMLGIHCSPERIVNFVDGEKTGANGYVDYGTPASADVPAPPKPAVWRGLDAEELRRQFDMRVAVPDGESYTQERAARSAPLRASLPGERDVRYGTGPRQTLDVYPGRPGGPIVVFFHGGGWRKQSKEAFAFVAEPLLAAGITAVIPSYDLHPQATMLQMMQQAREALAWTARTLSPDGRRRIVMAGHSAGAQLAAMALAHDYSKEGLQRSPAHAAFLISGSYDMEPHRHHPRYLDMGLDEVLVQKASPLRNPPLDTGIDFVVAAGGDETPGYLRQATEYCDLLRDRGHAADTMFSPGDHHFSVVGQLAMASHPLTLRLIDLAKGASL